MRSQKGIMELCAAVSNNEQIIMIAIPSWDSQNNGEAIYASRDYKMVTGGVKQYLLDEP